MNNRKAFAVRSRNFAKQFLCDSPWAAISVSTQPEEFPILSEINRVGLLQLSFWDVSNPKLIDDARVKDKLFTEDQAQQILEFTKEVWDKIDCMLVHCEAGFCRSPAIAAALTHIYYGKGEDELYFNRFSPNYLVYSTILKKHYWEHVSIEPSEIGELDDSIIQGL